MLLLTTFFLLSHTLPSAFGQESDDAALAVVAKVTAAAQHVVESLDEAQREKLLFNFDDREQRLRWSNLPSGIYERRGVRWGDLTEAQREAVMELFKATLSPAGVQQIVDNMEGDELLVVGPSRGGGGPSFGRDEFYLSFLGTPSTTQPWMWQFGGHHMAINATVVGDDITLSPTLTGGQPVDYELNGRQVRQLASEEDMSFELVGSLTPEQREQAVVDGDHADMIFGPGREGAKPQQEGINAARLNEEQRKLLLALIQERIGILNEVHAQQAMRRISENLDETWFAWFGPTEPGSVSSFRIQGPTILMEYTPQHLGGDATNHTHAMYRDPTNDYGAALLESRP
jgi:hypothetical protein